MYDLTIQRLRLEVEQIEQLLETYSALLESVDQGSPDLIAVTAVASVLHSFYTGVENIFGTIAKGIDHTTPEGARFHSELLLSMTSSTPHRTAVIDEVLGARLVKYLGFRHFYRHAYSFRLDWTEMADLVRDLEGTWHDLRSALLGFIEAISTQACKKGDPSGDE